VPKTFAVTWDYRCPFARNAHEHVLDGLAGGADWDVTFVAFSLRQVHVAEGETDVWDEPAIDTGLLALQAGVVVRDRFPDQFPAVHRGLFAARHDEGRRIDEPEVVRDVLIEAGVDADAVFEEIESGSVVETVRKEHEASVSGHEVFGVPTFISGERAVFVRVMDRPEGDTQHAAKTVDRIIGLLDGWPDLNEFKHTTRSR
jgi:protein-disulfide isomerase-like protein with CxxC motif